MRLGVTGGIGSGKSYVCSILEQRFAIPVYDCDSRAKLLMQSDEEVRQSLVRLIGEQVYDHQGLVRSEVARYLFASSDHAARVNAIVHPAVRRDYRLWCAHQQAPLLAMESAILFESGFDTEVDTTLFVDAPLETRIQRAIQRDGAQRQQIEERIARQDSEQSKQRAAYIIVNDGSADLEADLAAIVDSLTQNK